MKKFCEKAFGLRVLFCLTIVFIITAIAMGICIDTFLMQDSQRTLVSVLVGLTIAIFGIYLIVGYFYHIINFLVETHKQHGNVFKHYINDKNYRFSVNNTISCVYILITAFVNFVLSFSSFKWYFLLSSAIFFLLFIMKLYLTTNIGDDKNRQNKVIILLMMAMSFACAGVVVMLWIDKTAFSKLGLVIYWNALYVFVSFTMAVVGVVRAIKNKDRILGRFLAVKLANAVLGMFSLTVSMLMTFSENFQEMKLFALIVGVVTTLLINAIAVIQLLLYNSRNVSSESIETDV